MSVKKRSPLGSEAPSPSLKITKQRQKGGETEQKTEKRNGKDDSTKRKG